jgi:hypothetical protein
MLITTVVDNHIIEKIMVSLDKVLEAGHGKIEITVVNHEVVDIVETVRKRIK